jgi:hypothetical protein
LNGWSGFRPLKNSILSLDKLMNKIALERLSVAVPIEVALDECTSSIR